MGNIEKLYLLNNGIISVYMMKQELRFFTCLAKNDSLYNQNINTAYIVIKVSLNQSYEF